MIFYLGKINFVNYNKELSLKSDPQYFAYIAEKQMIGDYYAIKLKRESHEYSKGVLFEDESIMQLDKYVESNGDLGIFKLAYIFVNMRNKEFFYSCTKKVFESIIVGHFNIEYGDISYNASVEDLESINSFKLVQLNDETSLFNENFPLDNTIEQDMKSVILKNEIPRRKTLQYEYKSGIFNRNNLHKIIKKYNDAANYKLYITGLDKKGNAMNITDQIIKKIDIDTLNNLEDYSNKSLKDILFQIRSKLL